MGNVILREELNDLEKSLSGTSLKNTFFCLLFSYCTVRCMIYILIYFS